MSICYLLFIIIIKIYSRFYSRA